MSETNVHAELKTLREENKIMKVALQIYLAEPKLLRFFALALLFVAVVAAGIDPTWVRLWLASLMLCAYVATLIHSRKNSSQEKE